LSAGGGVFERVERAAVIPAAIRIAEQHSATTFTAWSTPILKALGVAEGLVKAGLQEISYPAGADPRPALNEAFLGIVEADLALAESGTIGLVSDPSRGRLVSCLPRVMVAILDPTRLLGRLEDLPAWLVARGGMPSSLTLVTGPSATGDIPGQLVRGAHGPAEVYVLGLD
jgi:L-lactate dehydrogenase complex protein LldG